MHKYQVAFIGLGSIGFHIAGHIKNAGHSVRVFNRTESKAKKWCDVFGGGLCENIASATKGADFVFSCVGGDSDLRDIYFSDDGVLANVKSGSVIIDHTSASQAIAIEIARRGKPFNVEFLDAPVSGGENGAKSGSLSVMVGGNAETFTVAKPLIDLYSSKLSLMGPTGAGQVCKLANQICIAGVIQGVAEAFALAKKSGLDIQQVLEVLDSGAAHSAQLKWMVKNIIDDDFSHGFAVEWMLKDLNNCLSYANENDLDLPMGTIVRDKFAQLQKLGCGRHATSILAKSIFNENPAKEVSSVCG